MTGLLERLMKLRPTSGEAPARSESEAQLRAIFRNVVDAIAVIDSEGRILDFNPAAERIFGYAPEEVLGQNVKMLMPEPDRGRHDGYIRNYVHSGQPQIIGKGREVMGRRKDGGLVPLELAVSEVEFDGRRLFTGIMRDISERKQAEETLRQAKLDAEAANRAKSAFLANMSHELRTPLNAIIGYSELMYEEAEERDDRATLDDLRRIDIAARHLLTLINDVLDLSKIEAGKMGLEILEIDCCALTRDVSETVRPLAERHGNRLVVDCPGNVGSFASDPTKLRQVLFNLLANATKFTQDGDIVMTVRREGGSMLFAVTDTGIGMTDDQLEHMFEDFAQAEHYTDRGYGGTGLGLAISRRFCRMLGGDLTVESQPGEGSRFVVDLPLQPPSAPGADPA